VIFQSVYSLTYLATGICAIGSTDTATEVTTVSIGFRSHSLTLLNTLSSVSFGPSTYCSNSIMMTNFKILVVEESE
jgi:hypothetical protein